MKRLLAMLLVIALMCSVSACSLTDDAKAVLSAIEKSEEESSVEEASSAEPVEKAEAQDSVAEVPAEEPEKTATDTLDATSGLVSDVHITLEEYASFPYIECKFSGDIDNKYAPYTEENGQATCYTYSGDIIGTYNRIKTSNVEFPYVICGEDNGTENCFGLYSVLDGTVLPCEAAMYWQLSDRFMQVIYSTGVTENEEDCMFYATTDAIILHSQPSEGDVMYTGIMRIYDLQERAFVPGIEVTDGGGAAGVKATNDRIFMKKVIYDANGDAVGDLTGSNLSCVTNFSYKVDGVVYASDGAVLFEAPNGYMPITGTGDYFWYSENGQEGILDRNGEVVIKAEYDDDISSKNLAEQLADGLVMVEKDDRCSLLDLQGNTIIDFEETHYSHYFSGRYSMWNDDGTNSIWLRNGEIINGLEYSHVNLIEKQDSNDYRAYVWNTGSYDITEKKYIDNRSNNLIVTGNEDGTKSIYEILYGECLWTGMADKVTWTEDYVFVGCKDDNLFTVYKVCQ